MGAEVSCIGKKDYDAGCDSSGQMRVVFATSSLWVLNEEAEF